RLRSAVVSSFMLLVASNSLISASTCTGLSFRGVIGAANYPNPAPVGTRRDIPSPGCVGAAKTAAEIGRSGDAEAPRQVRGLGNADARANRRLRNHLGSPERQRRVAQDQAVQRFGDAHRRAQLART